MSNLFNKSKSKSVTKTVEKKINFPIVNIDSLEFFDKVATLEQLQKNIKRDKVNADVVADQIKDTGKIEWTKIFENSGVNPGSIIVESTKDGKTARVMIAPSDKYLTIDKVRADELTEKYGEDVISEDTTFMLDTEMINKYGEVISGLIENCEEIEDEDREKIIKAVVKYSIKKGTIDKLKQFGNVSDVMEQVNPIVAMRDVEVING